MGLIDTLGSWFRDDTQPQRSLSFDEWLSYFSYDGNSYPYQYGLQFSSPGEKTEEIGRDFAALVQQAYKANGVIFACMLARLSLFSEARFQYRRLRSGRPGELFGGSALSLLEHPGPGQTTGDLLTRALQDADLAGNYFANRRGNRIRRMRPDWVSIVLGSETDAEVGGDDLDAEVLGYLYYPGGKGGGRDPEVLLRDEVCHFAPVPDPIANYRGMSWLTPIIRDLMADQAATSHKLRFLEEGGSRNLAIKLDTADPEQFKEWKDAVAAKNDGLANAYKTLYIAQGMEVIPVGVDFQQLELKATQGGGETRIAAAAGVPPVIVGLSEGLEAATYSNYALAMRRFADLTMRPLWRNMAGSLATIVDVPADAELWYDDRDIPALKEDVKDAAEIQGMEAATIRTLIDAGYLPETVVDAVRSGDWTRLKHSELFSVQLQPPGTVALPPSGNGVVPPELVPVGEE